MADGTMIRTIEEITASARMNMADMVNRAIALGHDLADAKELLGHGAFLPWLNTIGISSSTAANYMKVAREIAPGSRLANLPYSKVLALLAVPAEEREKLAEETEGKSAAEIRRLIAERDKAAEACNAETARADQAEADAKRFYDDNGELRTMLQNREHRMKELIKEKSKLIDDLKQAGEREQELKGKLVYAENNRIEVEVLPKNYEEQRQQLIDAAAAAEERAAAAEEELENLRNQQANGGNSEFEKLHYNMKVFMLNCEMMAVDVTRLIPDRDKAIRDIDRIAHWCAVIRDSLASAVIGAEGAVVE